MNDHFLQGVENHPTEEAPWGGESTKGVKGMPATNTAREGGGDEEKDEARCVYPDTVRRQIRKRERRRLRE